MNKKVLLGLTAGAVLGVSALITTNTQADTSTNATTDGSISFFDTNKPGEGPFAKSLAFAYVPTEFKFGNHDVTGVENAVTYRQEIDANKKQYLAVADDRDNKLKGWKVVASASEFRSNTSTETNPDKLDAELSFQIGENQKYNMDPALSDKSGVPTPGITEAGSLSPLTDPEKGYYGVEPSLITLVAGTGTQDVLSYNSPAQAPADFLGVAREISSVQLKVKDHTGVAGKKYTGTVNWVLAEDVK